MMIIKSIKQRLHREICADPVLHACVLNLYLNGEDYPHRVNDYFPVEETRHSDLRDKMNTHIGEEDKHIALYKRAITKLQQPVVTLAMPDIYNHVIRACTDADFSVKLSDSKDKQDLNLAHFFAHLHFLEKRIAQSLDIHADACQYSPCDYTGKVVRTVLSDELTHVEYTLEAVRNLLPDRLARTILTQHQQAESRANFLFSSQQLRKLMMLYDHRFPRFSKWVYRFSCNYLERATTYA